MSAYVLIPGGDTCYWHLLEPELRGRSHDVVAVDLPADDDSAGLKEYAGAVVEEIGGRTGIVLVAEARARREPRQSGTPFEEPWPLPEWPDVPTRVLQGRDDRFFPVEFQRRVVRERLSIATDEMAGGHLLARPKVLADRLEEYRRKSVATPNPARAITADRAAGRGGVYT